MHLQKNKKGDSRRIMLEAYREIDSKSEHFDKAESNKNRNLWSYEKAVERLNERINNNKVRNKETVITLTAIITKPKELKDKDIDKFFNLAIKYHNEKLGKENIIYGCLHNDELNTHLHLCYTPIKDGKFQAKNIMNKDFLKSYHKDFQELCDKEFNYHLTIERSEQEKELDPRLSMKEYKANRKRERSQQEDWERAYFNF